MKRVFGLIALLVIAPIVVMAQTTRVVCDESCKTESGATAVKGDVFAVVSPVGRGTVQMIEMAPRLNSLEGKTIAVVGGSFMARVTHPEIKRLIEQHYPTSRVILLDEIQTLFDSRNFDAEFYRVFCQLRKRDIKIVGTAQVFERCALPLREQVHDLYYCKTLLGCLTRQKKYYPLINQSGRLATDLPSLGTTWIVQNNRYRSMYDTFYKV